MGGGQHPADAHRRPAAVRRRWHPGRDDRADARSAPRCARDRRHRPPDRRRRCRQDGILGGRVGLADRDLRPRRVGARARRGVDAGRGGAARADTRRPVTGLARRRCRRLFRTRGIDAIRGLHRPARVARRGLSPGLAAGREELPLARGLDVGRLRHPVPAQRPAGGCAGREQQGGPSRGPCVHRDRHPARRPRPRRPPDLVRRFGRGRPRCRRLRAGAGRGAPGIVLVAPTRSTPCRSSPWRRQRP